MNNQELFKDKFNKNFEYVYDFIYDFDNDRNPLNLELISNNDVIAHDSYGNEDSVLKRVFRDEELDLYISFEGTRCSYEGEEWSDYKFVNPVNRTVTYYE